MQIYLLGSFHEMLVLPGEDILKLKNDNDFMCSFDVKNLFTNIPIDETLEIILSKLFPTSNSTFLGYERKTFSKLLEICTKNNMFIFNKQLYRQIDGAPMGGSISPLLADIFLGFSEEKWLENCPPEFKPFLYRKFRAQIKQIKWSN